MSVHSDVLAARTAVPFAQGSRTPKGNATQALIGVRRTKGVLRSRPKTS